MADRKKSFGNPENTDFDYRINSFIPIFLIIDERLPLSEEEKDIAILPPSREVNMYKSHGWLKFNDKIVRLGVNVIAYTLIRLKAKLSLPENCPDCFPDCSKEKNNRKEKFLFSTHPEFETPMLIMGTPRFAGEPAYTHKFSSVMKFPHDKKNPHLYGNISINNIVFSSYLRGNVFYENNRRQILDFFAGKLSRLVKDVPELLIIASDNKHSSNFAEEIVLRKCFENKKVSILRYVPSHEFVDNFISLYSRFLRDDVTIIYFEDVLSGGRTFKLISDYIGHSTKDKTRSRGFDILLTLTDRTTYYTKNEIIRELPAADEDTVFIPFFKLNVPTGDSVHLGDPFKRNHISLKKVMAECHLDALKTIVAAEILSSTPQSLYAASYKADRAGDRELFLPLSEKDPAQIEFYAKLFTKKKFDHFRLYLTHEIIGKLSLPDYAAEGVDVIQKLFSEVSLPDEIIFENGDNIPALRNPDFEKRIIENMIFRILSQPPFTYYESIYRSVFNHCINILEDKEGKVTSSYEFINLKMLIKSSVELNSNYIISEKFLGYIKKEFENNRLETFLKRYNDQYAKADEEEKTTYTAIIKRKLEYKYRQLVSYNYFMLYCYKILTSRNPSRSIRLETILSSADFMPSGLKDDKDELIVAAKELKDFFHNPYYLFHRILKAENIYFLNELKEYHRTEYPKFYSPEKNETLFNVISETGVAGLRKTYFTKKSDPVIRNAQMLIDSSGGGRREKEETPGGRKENTTSSIHTAVCNMLKTMSLIEEGKKASQSRDRDEKYRSNIDTDIKKILDSVLTIIQPEDKEAELGYAFFIEYVESEKNENNLYPVLSDAHSKKDNIETLRLHPDGLIRNALRGLADTIDCTNPQTFLFAGKAEDNSTISFQDNYYTLSHSRHSGKPDNKKNTSYFLKNKNIQDRLKSFEKMFEKDRWDSGTKEGLKFMDDINMCLIFRLSNITEQDNYTLKGKAVLVITNKGKKSKKAFTDFMNIDKIRLLLLIKEDLLAYIESLFGNNFFIELLQNRQKEIAGSKLDHGIQNYLLMQYDLLKVIAKKKNPEKSDDYHMLLKIITKAIEGQHSFRNQNINSIQISDEPIPYSTADVLERLRLIFESDQFSGPVNFETVAVFGFEDEVITMKEYVFDIVIPEIIYNMKKYSTQLLPNRFTVNYTARDRTLVFSNNMKDETDIQITEKAYGGINMCREVMKSLNYPDIITIISINQYITTLNLNLIV